MLKMKVTLMKMVGNGLKMEKAFSFLPPFSFLLSVSRFPWFLFSFFLFFFSFLLSSFSPLFLLLLSLLALSPFLLSCSLALLLSCALSRMCVFEMGKKATETPSSCCSLHFFFLSSMKKSVDWRRKFANPIGCMKG
jgi:hypothetical protein